MSNIHIPKSVEYTEPVGDWSICMEDCKHREIPVETLASIGATFLKFMESNAENVVVAKRHPKDRYILTLTAV